MSIGKFKTWFKYFALNSNAESRAKTKQTTFSARLIFLEKKTFDFASKYPLEFAWKCC